MRGRKKAESRSFGRCFLLFFQLIVQYQHGTSLLFNMQSVLRTTCSSSPAVIRGAAFKGKQPATAFAAAIAKRGYHQNVVDHL